MNFEEMRGWDVFVVSVNVNGGWFVIRMLKVEAPDVIELETQNEIDSNLQCTDTYEVSYTNTDIRYSDFFRRYLYRNRPCIIRGPVTESWKSASEWISDNRPNFSYISQKFGNVTVPVSNCAEKHYNTQKVSDTQLCDYMKYWQDYSSKSHSHLPCLYLKDWHFTQDFPEENMYRVPKYFASDWLNEYYSAKTSIQDDYRFVYMGPKGSWTPLHADVFTSFSWSVNVCGRKRWLLFPPGEEARLRDRFGQLTYDATVPELLDEKLYPRYKGLCRSEEIIQEAGEAIFIPSGWHHQVWNLEDTISINHNWINGCNIETMWTSMKESLMAVKKEIEDCKDMDGWDEHCQLMLQEMFGMNYEEFYSFLIFIVKRRLDSLRNNEPVLLFGNWQLGRNHILFDLIQLKTVLIIFTKDVDTKSLSFFKNLDDQSEELIKEIEHYIL